MRVICKLDSAILGLGFTFRRGKHTGELDDRGVVWLDTAAVSRLHTTGRRTIGVSTAKFAYIEDASEPASQQQSPTQRTVINEAPRANTATVRRL